MVETMSEEGIQEFFSCASDDGNINIKIYDVTVHGLREGSHEQQADGTAQGMEHQEKVVEVIASKSPRKSRRKTNLPVRLQDHLLSEEVTCASFRGLKRSSKLKSAGADVNPQIEAEDNKNEDGIFPIAHNKRKTCIKIEMPSQDFMDTQSDKTEDENTGNGEDVFINGEIKGSSPRASDSNAEDVSSINISHKTNTTGSKEGEGVESFRDGETEESDDLGGDVYLTVIGKQEIVCKRCHKRYPSKSSYRRHQKACQKHLKHAHKKDSKMCQWCLEKFLTVHQRNEHNRKEHTQKKSYPCCYCKRVFTESSHCKRHLRTHTGERPFACEVCGKEFVDNSYIRRHMRIHDGEKPFQCDQCGKTFREKTHLSCHEETHKRELVHCSKCNKACYGDENRCVCIDKANHTKIVVTKNYNCEKCGKGFAKEGNFQRHLRDHEKGLPKMSVFVCDVCQKEFSLERRLLRHKRIHTGEKPFQCPVCSKKFCDGSYIRRHMRIHSGRKPFQCDRCDRSFRESGHLARHMLTHTGEKKFNCSTCGKGYQDKVCLLRHESKCVVSTVSPNVKPSQLCDICGKEFTGKGSLRRHRAMHSGNRTHQCNLCSAQFYDNSGLRRHITIHNRDPANINQCTHCNRVFRTGRALSLHSMTHADKPEVQIDKFECKICNCELPDHTALTLHAATHPGQLLPLGYEVVQDTADEPEMVTNLECKICNRLFATEQNLANHELTHSQPIVGSDTLTPSEITIVSSPQVISTEVMMPSALLESSVAGNSDDFEGLFKLLQVIAQANQGQCATPHPGNLPATINVSTGVHLSSSESNNAPQVVRVVSSENENPAITHQIIGQGVTITSVDLEHAQLEEVPSLDNAEHMEDPFLIEDALNIEDESSDSEFGIGESLHCEHCTYECTRDKKLAVHMAKVHPGIVFAKKPKDKEAEKIQQWQCPFCNDVFEVEQELRGHTCKGIKDKPFKCPRCDMSFPRRPALNQHLKIHEGEPKYKCSFCQKTFYFKNSLAYHERIHTQEKPFLCKSCGKGFKDKSHLRRHEKIHEGVKPYSCKICPKAFLERSQLVKHIRVHSGEKPYLCAKCGKSFADASHLRRHTSLHEKRPERDHKCPDCPKAFRSRDGLRSHKKIHIKEKTFICDICDKAFSDNTILKRHQRCHREEKPYSCQICNKPFRERCHLVKHFRVHTGDKPYPCTVCDKRFADTPQRKRHVMNAHASCPPGDKLSQLSFCHVCGEAFTEMGLLHVHLQGHRTGFEQGLEKLEST